MLQIDLQGRVALVTGGSRGIGAGITATLCKAGCSTWFTHTGNRDNRKRIDTLLEEIRGLGGEAQDMPLDALDAAGMRELVQALVESKGRVDILVINVGKNSERLVEDMSDEGWQRNIDLNLSSAYYGIRAVIPHMLRQSYGRIILIGSSASYDGGGGAIDYAAAKAGMRGMMLYLCKTYTRKGINSNIVHPCVIATDLVRERYSTKEKWAQLESQIPVGRVGTPEDIGAMVAFLVSPLGDYITGQEILLDGGRTLWRA